jgi:hypothetical protein
MMTVVEFQSSEEGAGLEPLGRRRASRGIGTPLRAVFDVLYEAGEPLDAETLAERTFDRVEATTHYHARRAYIRERWRGAPPASHHRTNLDDIPLDYAWRQHLKKSIRDGVRRRVLVRLEGERFAPNPAKPPRVQQPDGRVVPYTREQALGLSEHERAIGDVIAIRPELNRLLSGLDQGELRQVVELAATAFSPRSGERTDPRTLRARLTWLLNRPTTDAGRAWLLGELVRRAYGDPPTS